MTTYDMNQGGFLMMYYDLSGLWQADIGDGMQYPCHLPGTLDENGIGPKDPGKNLWNPEGMQDSSMQDSEPEVSSVSGNDSDFDSTAGSGRPISTRLTRKHAFEGCAKLHRHLTFLPPKESRVFLEAERARCLRLMVNGKEVPHFLPPSLSTPHIFEITGLLNGADELVLLSDNSYPGLPYDAILNSSAATDETQTNWNGLLGYLRLRIEHPVFLSDLRVYPNPEQGCLTIQAEIASDRPWEGEVLLQSSALAAPASLAVRIDEAGVHLFQASELALAEGLHTWDEDDGFLYELQAVLRPSSDGCGAAFHPCLGEDFQDAALPGETDRRTASFGSRTVSFGVRSFRDDGTGRLALNGRRIFLRGEANCCVFPETGHPPMTVDAWTDVLKRFRSYGVNLMRFHSYCPPEAAFVAADQLGMLMQPELSHWDCRTAFESDESYSYYRTELTQILLRLANHPSFVMLTLGNELAAGPTGHGRMDALLRLAHSTDQTRLYANGSNVHYGHMGCDPASDFYTSQNFYDSDLRAIKAGEGEEGRPGGYLNRTYPSASVSYDASMERLRTAYSRPVFSFEVGQYEVLPDFAQLKAFQGVTVPANLSLIQKRVEKSGLTQEQWQKQVEASGQLARLCYREEAEAALRTSALSGICLLGLQDFPGQGTALVGMLDAHLEPKPYPFAAPEAFASFSTGQLPLALLPRYTWESTETLSCSVKIANYGKHTVSGCPQYLLKLHTEMRMVKESALAGETILAAQNGAFLSCPPGELTETEPIRLPLDAVTQPCRLDLEIRLGSLSNTYPLWVYPPVHPVKPDCAHETERFDETAQRVLEEGGIVYLTPPATPQALPSSIPTQFSTDFWSVGTFPQQPGGMGQLIDAGHPLFEDFPTEAHSNWQWWPMASQRAFLLPARYQAIVAEMDSYAYLRPMAKLLECRCGKGRLLLSSMGLQNLQQYPESRALLASIYRYLSGEQFHPAQEIPMDVISGLVAG